MDINTEIQGSIHSIHSFIVYLKSINLVYILNVWFIPGVRDTLGFKRHNLIPKNLTV